MTQVDFHTLDEASDAARLKTACVLIENAFLAGERVLVWLDESNLTAFDNLLWTFSDRAFVPHEMLGADPLQCEAPVQLTALAELPAAAFAGFAKLVQLRATASAASLNFPTVIEVIDADPARRDAGRARFRFYREHGAEPRHHKVPAKN
jgi:DNA polymerase III subunit chi